MRFGDDWPGIFIRGDNAMHFAMHLDNLIKGDKKNVISPIYCAELAKLLRSCYFGPEDEPDMQKAELK
jgi:hypothetical protein